MNSDDPGEDDPDELPPLAPVGNQGFCFRGKHVGLTYAQCGLSMEEFGIQLMFELNERKVPVAKWVIGHEQHADGGWHFHVYLGLIKRLQSKNVAIFDVEQFHPNIKRFKSRQAGGGDSQIDRWISYCKKSGKWRQEGFLSNLFTLIHWKDYRKNRADLSSWEADAKDQQRVTPFPFNLPNGQVVVKPQVNAATGEFVKRRHWLILGPPDAGKSKWVNKTFKG